MVEADDLHASFTDDLWAWTNGLLRATLSGAPIVGGDSGCVRDPGRVLPTGCSVLARLPIRVHTDPNTHAQAGSACMAEAWRVFLECACESFDRRATAGAERGGVRVEATHGSLVLNGCGGLGFAVVGRQVQVRLGTEELSVYGDVKGNRPTGVVSFELRVVLPYVGKVYLGDACMGELCGYINVPQVSPTTLEQVSSRVYASSVLETPTGHHFRLKAGAKSTNPLPL